MNKQLAEIVEGAFDYHPFGWNQPMSVGDYAIGPTFIAWCPEFEAQARTRVYTDVPTDSFAVVARSILGNPPDPDPELLVMKDAHKRMRTKDNCKARALAMGEYEMDIEIAYSLYKLMRFYKPKQFAVRDGMLYAWDDERIVFVGATRPRILNCVEAGDVQEDR